MKLRDGLEARHLVGRIVTDADGAKLPLFVEFAKGGGCLLDGDEWVGPVHLIDIDIVRLETPERILELLENTLARGIAFDFAIRPIESNFGGKDDVLSATTLAQGFAHDFFTTPISATSRCVDHVDTLLARALTRPHALF